MRLLKSGSTPHHGKRVGFPRFKSKNTAMRFAYSTHFTAPTASDPYGLKLSRIGRVHCMENVYKRVNGAHVIRVSVSCRAGRWYASLTVEREQPSSPAHTRKRGVVGVDLGIKHLATLSDGTVIPNPRAFKVAGSAPETLNARGGDVRRADIVSGNADPSETRTKQPPAGGVRLGAGLGNEAMRSRTN